MPFKNKEKQKAYQKAYQKVYREANKEKILENEKAYYEANKEKIAEQGKAYRKANKDKIAEQRKAYRKANKEKIAEQKKLYKRRRRAKDPLFRLKHNYRHSCRKAFYSINKKKNNSSLKLLGLKTWQQLAKHLSKQFYNRPETGEQMTFDNYGVYGWHIDHIIPLDSAKTEEEIIKLCHYTNLQPMWAEENIAKSNKTLDTQ